MFMTLLLITTNSHAGFAPPDNYILPTLIIKELKNNTLYLNRNIALNVDNVMGSWKNIPYELGVGDLKTIKCESDSKETSRALICNNKYLLQPDDTLHPEYHSCKERSSSRLINRETGKEIRLTKKLSGCTVTTGMIESDGWLWFSSYWDASHSQYFYGDGLFRVHTTSGEVEFISRNGKEKQGWSANWKDYLSEIQLLSLIADEKNNAIWFTSTLGLHHLNLDTQNLTNYFTQLYIDDKNQIRVALSKTKPKHNFRLYMQLTHFKIHDKTGFAKTWSKLNLNTNHFLHIRQHDDLSPYYLETLRYLSNSEEDTGLFSSFVSAILKSNKNKYTSELEQLYNSDISLNKQAKLEYHFQKNGLKPTYTPHKTANDYLRAFLDGKRTDFQLCQFYLHDKSALNQENIDLLTQTGEQLTDILTRCFDQSGDLNLEDKRTNAFISQLYNKNNLVSKIAVCHYMNRKKWYQTDNQLLEKVVLDIPVFTEAYGNESNECANWLLRVITTDEQIVFIQKIRSSHPNFTKARTDLFTKLQGRRDFPFFKRHHAQMIKQQEDACILQRKTESDDEWIARCKAIRDKFPKAKKPQPTMSEDGWYEYNVIINNP